MNTIKDSIRYLNNNYIVKKNLLSFSVDQTGDMYNLFLNNTLLSTGSELDISDRLEILCTVFRTSVLNRSTQ